LLSLCRCSLFFRTRMMSVYAMVSSLFLMLV
jgi:hypothetical protein